MSGGTPKGKLELCGDDGKIRQQFQQKGILVRWEQPEGLSPVVFELPGVSHHAGDMWDSARVGQARGWYRRGH